MGLPSVVGGIGGAMLSSAILGDASRRAASTIRGANAALNSANAQQRSDFMPYMDAGKEAIGSYQETLARGSGATMPTQSEAFNYDPWTDPSTQYAIQSSNDALLAAGLSGGKMGGGLARATAANTQQQALQAYQNAFDRYQKQSAQNFGQQQQLYNNQTQNWQNMLSGYGNLMGQGQSAAGTSGNLGLGYNQQISNNLNNLASLQYGSGANQAGIWGDALSGALSGIGGLV